MLFRFEPTALASGLRLIEEIPDQRLCRLEGRNGIGKSLAVRLLELITGGQPYAGLDLTWQSLRDSLGPTTITVSGLRLSSDNSRNHQLKWLLDPSTWPNTPREDGPWTSALLDGREVELSQVRRILRVFRIAGDESLPQSFAATVNLDRQRLRGLSDRVAERAGAWDRILQGLVGVAGTTTAASLSTSEQARVDSRRVLRELARSLQVAEAERRRLSLIAELIASRTAIQEQLPALQTEREQLARQQQALRDELARLDEQAAWLRGQAERDRDDIQQLIQDESLVRKRRDRLARRQREIRALMRQLQLSELPGSQEGFRSLQIDNRRRLAAAKMQRRTLDRVGLLMDVSEEIRIPLDRALRDGLGDEVIAELDGELALTIAMLTTGVQKRRISLDQQVSREGSRLQAEIADLERRQPLLVELERIARLLHGAHKDLTEVEARLHRQIRALSGDAAEQYRQLSETRTSKLDELEALAAQAQEVDQRIARLLSNGDLTALHGRLAELQAADITGEELSSAIQESDDRVRNLLDQQDAARRALVSTEATLRSQRAELERAMDQLVGPEWAWLAEAGVSLPDPEESLELQAVTIDALRTRAEHLRDEITEARNDLDSLRKALEVFSSALGRGATSLNLLQRFAPAVLSYYEQVFSAQLAAPEVRRALFDGGSEVQLDLSRMTASWLTPARERRKRPLEAFSSGERAFAYTRVQLERLKEEQAANKVAFLDEFGAYIASDRLQDLLSFLHRRALRELADQIVIILPLTSHLRGTQAEQVENRNYFTVDLSEAGAFEAVGA